MSTRRTIAATAGAITLTVLAGSAALAANLGLLDGTEGDKVGNLSPIATQVSQPHQKKGAATTDPEVETVVVDEYVTVPASGGAAAPGAAVAPPTAPSVPVATPTAPPASSPSSYDDSDDAVEHESEDAEPEDEVESESDDGVEHESEAVEYEGAEDDD